MNNTTQIPPGFYGLGIAPRLLEILERNKYTVPTPIQQQAIPIAIDGKDVMGIAQTGTGKTLAFGVPLIQRLAQLGNGARALVILPTRELALQVDETMQKLGRPIGLRTAVLIGGASMGRQMDELKKRPHVLIVTPGRLIDHLDQHTVKLDEVKILVLDEADRMLDMGFAPQINRILKTVPKERQTMLFSATMPAAITSIANSYMKLPVRVEIARAGTMTDRVTQEVYVVKKEDKLRLLDKLLKEHHGTVLVFSRTKHGAKKIAAVVRGMGHRAAEIHANRSLNQRREALDGFKNGKYRVLVATDIAARGIDVKEIELVVNFDLPDNPDDYVHRIGRTGRAGHSGHAVSFATPDQGRDVREIEKLTRTMLPIAKLPELPPMNAKAIFEETPDRRFGGGGYRGHRPGGSGHRPMRDNGSRDGSRPFARRPGHGSSRGASRGGSSRGSR